jgi:hypothetical protein
MIRLVGFGLVPLLLFALWLYCIFDVIASDAVLVRNLPKGAWLILVIFLPDIGSLAWLLLGRPLYAGWRPGDTTSRRPPPPRALAPEDSPDFPRRALPSDEERLRAWEEDLRRREEELRRDEEGGSSSDPG